MSTAVVDLDALVLTALTSLNEPTGAEARPETSSRERFFELLVLILANLYGKTPVSAALFDRNTLLRVTTGMDDSEAGRFTTRTEDWLRLEGMLRQQDGTKSYFLTRTSLAVLSTITYAGTLGEVFEQILKRYQAAMPNEDIRNKTRVLGSYFLTRVARS
jgi:hypothetical protein